MFNPASWMPNGHYLDLETRARAPSLMRVGRLVRLQPHAIYRQLFKLGNPLCTIICAHGERWMAGEVEVRPVDTGNIPRGSYSWWIDPRDLLVVDLHGRAATTLQSAWREQLARKRSLKRVQRVQARLMPVSGCAAPWRPAEPEKATAVPHPKHSKTPPGESCSKGAGSSSLEQVCAATARTRKRRKRRRQLRARVSNEHARCSAQPGNRAARRLNDPAVQERRKAHLKAMAQAAATDGEPSGGAEHPRGKRTYSIEQMLALRPRPPSPLSASSPIFVPRASRYSCLARAVKLGLADPPPWQRPVPSAAARKLCARVHSLLLGRS